MIFGHATEAGDFSLPTRRIKVAVRHSALVLFAAIRQQARSLHEPHDPSWPALDCFIKCSPRNPVITGKSDQLLDVAFSRS